MITIISGTNRLDNNTRKVAEAYRGILEKNHQISASLLALDEEDMTMRSANFIKQEEELLFKADKFIIIMPEYNGSYPGILKLMIDQSDVKRAWWHKRVLLVGISTGRAGNLRGMEHLTGVLLHLKMLVHPNRLPLSIVDKLMDARGQFTDAGTINAIESQLAEFIKF